MALKWSHVGFHSAKFKPKRCQYKHLLTIPKYNSDEEGVIWAGFLLGWNRILQQDSVHEREHYHLYGSYNHITEGERAQSPDLTLMEIGTLRHLFINTCLLGIELKQ